MKKADRDMYELFMQEFDFCMACGIPDGIIVEAQKCGADYPRHLENAHILRGACQRRTDRRAILRLCKLCHDIADGPDQPTQKDINGQRLPKLTRANLLWIKCWRDPDHYDLEYLNSIAIRIMPEQEEPPEWFQLYFMRWQL